MPPNKPVFNNQIGDVYEGLQDQAGDVVSGLKNVVMGQAPVTDKSDGSGIEQLTGQKTDDGGPASAKASAGKQGLNPQQLVEKREEEKKKIEFFREQTQGWD